MNIDVVRCEAVDDILKELAMFALAYNLIFSVTVESARVQGVGPDRISLVDTGRWLIGLEGGDDLSMLVVNPQRPGRIEPRVVKRRPERYMRIKKPMLVLCNQLPMKGF